MIWFQDLRDPYSRSRQVAHFHTPDALLEMLTRDLDAAANWLQTYPTAHPILRPYQHEAINAIEAVLLHSNAPCRAVRFALPAMYQYLEFPFQKDEVSGKKVRQ